MKVRCFRCFTVLPVFILIMILPGELDAQADVVKRELPGYGLVEFFDSQIIVRYREDVSTAQIQGINEQLRASQVTQVSQKPLHILSLDDMSVEEAVHTFSQRPEVLYAEPNFLRRRIGPLEYHQISRHITEEDVMEGVHPDDRLIDALWALRNEGQTLPNTSISGTPGADIKAYLAWELTKGSEDVIVAVFDSGIDYTHPDLADNMYRDEEDRFGIDCSPTTLMENDDECGFDPIDEDDGHGTHVAGTIGAVGNNGIGVSGVSWNVRLMAVKIFDDEGITSTESIIKGMEYALANGAVISNHSYGGYGFSQGEFDVFEAARDAGHLAVTAAANNALINDNEIRAYPASFELDNIIAVGATTFNDELASFSNHGVNSVHIAAPGTYVASTFPDNEYIYATGTSMASPHVAGVAALVKSLFPEAGYTEIRDRILERADQLESLEGLIMGSRRVNALTALLDDDGSVPAAITDLKSTRLGQSYAGLEWTAVGYSGNTGFAKSYELRISQNPITESNFDQAELIEKQAVPMNAGELQTLTLRNLMPGTTYYAAVKAEGFFENKSGISNVFQFTTNSTPELQVFHDGFDTSLSTGETDTFSFTVSNTGEGTLDLHIQDQFLPQSLADSEPNSFSYLIANSFDDQGTTFDWQEIGDIGNVISFEDSQNGAQLVELPFTFPFYGVDKNEVYISVNGFLSFSPVVNSTGSASNKPLPTGIGPNDLIAVHWSDFDLSDSGRVITHHDETNGRFIIQWENVKPNPGRLFTNQFYTFQVILYKGGTFKKQYLELEPSTRLLTVGIENQQGNTGELFAFNQLTVDENMALTYLPAQPEWIKLSETSIQLETAESREINVTLDARALLPGNYYTEIFFTDNDLFSDPVRIPVSLTVEGETAFVQFIHNSADPELHRVDIFLNGRIFTHNLFFNTSTGWIEVPAGLDLDMKLITQNSQSRSDAIEQKVTRFEPDREVMAVMSGMSRYHGDAEFTLFTREKDEQEVDNDNLRLIIFNGIPDVPDIGLFGYYPDDLPPLHILDQLPFGQFTEVMLEDPRDMELDVIQGHDLLDSFEFNNGSLGGQTLLLTATGLANPQQDEPGISVLANDGSTSGFQLPKVTNEDQIARHIPEQFELRQNYPNPFNPTTNILFRLPRDEHVRIDIYDILGRPVQTLLNEPFQAGIHTVTFNGSSFSSGIYFFRVQAGNESLIKKMMLIK